MRSQTVDALDVRGGVDPAGYNIEACCTAGKVHGSDVSLSHKCWCVVAVVSRFESRFTADECMNTCSVHADFSSYNIGAMIFEQ